MANFFDIADNWNKTLQREVEASNARQSELEANLTKALQPLIDEAQRLAAVDFPIGSLWEGSKSFKRDAYVTHVGDAHADLYSGDYYTVLFGTEDLKVMPTITVKVRFQSVPSPKKGSVIDGDGVVYYYIGKDGSLVRYVRSFDNYEEAAKVLLYGRWTTPSVGTEVQDFSKYWS